MAKANPSAEDWHDLIEVAWNVESIVSDGDSLGGNYLKGLLTLAANSNGFTSAKSRLATVGARNLWLSNDSIERLKVALPGIEDLGGNRSARIEALSSRLPELPAYRWLKDHDGYRSALLTLARLAARNPEYRIDVREFLLLQAFTLHLLIFQQYESQGSTLKFPSRSEISNAQENAQQLLSFLSAEGQIYGPIRVTPKFKAELHTLNQELQLLSRSYRRPQTDEKLHARVYLEHVVKGLVGSFGCCSPVIALHLASLAGYSLDSSDLRRKIRVIEQQVRRKALAGGLGRA